MKRLITFTGPSGTGKTTLIQLVRERFPEMRMITNTTTREARKSDLPGEYEYVTRETFGEIERDGEFLWTSPHTQNRYGTARRHLMSVLNDSTALGITHLSPDVMEILYGILRQKDEWVQTSISFFLENPTSEGTLWERLQERGETDAFIAQRLSEERHWTRDAHRLDVPFRFVPGDVSLEEAFNFVLAAIASP